MSGRHGFQGSTVLTASVLLLTGLALPLQSRAGVVQVIDFENYGSTYVYPQVSEAGFDFKPVSGGLAVNANGADCSPRCATNGTTSLLVGGTGLAPATVAPVTMSSAHPVVFRLLGLDFAEAYQSAATHRSAGTILMTGTLQGGGTLSQTLTLDGLNDGPGGANDFQAASLDAAWASSELRSLTFAGFDGQNGNRAFQLDNISVDVTTVAAHGVPEPASLALSLLALAAASLPRHRAKRSALPAD